VLFGTGEGQTNPPGVDGRPATTVFPKPLGAVKVFIGGIQADVAYAGAAPFLVAGVLRQRDDTAGVPSARFRWWCSRKHIQSAGLTVSVK